MVFTASVEGDSETKTVLQPDRMSVWWSPRDSIRIFYGKKDTYTSGIFVSTNSEPAGKASFSGSLEMFTGTIEDEEDPSVFIAVYPSKVYGSSYFNPFGGSISINLPAEQVAADNTFAKGMFPAIAQSENTSLRFYNVCGGIVFTVDGTDIKTVTLTGNNGEGVAGECLIDMRDGGIPEARTYSGTGSSSVTLKAPNGGTFTPGVRYFISVYPQNFEKGITLTFFKASSKSDVTWTKPATIKRSHFLVIEHADSSAGEYEYAIPEEAYNDMDALYESFALNIASRATASLYSPQRMLFNLCGDDVYGAGSYFGDNDAFLGALNEYRFDSNNEVVKNLYTGYYTFIQSANSFIGKYQNDIPEFMGAARVLRAYSYMMLAIGWGTPPWFDHVLKESEYPYNCDRDPDPDHSITHAQLLEWCAQECEASAQILEERSSPQDVQGAYRVTKGFAQAVAGKAYLFAGNYEKAKNILGAVINSAKYALVPGAKYWENFHVEGDGNEEKLFEPNLEYNAGIGAWGGPIQRSTWMEANLLNWRSDHFKAAPHSIYTGGCDGWGGLGVPQWFGDEFFANDGHSYRFDATLMHIDDAVYWMEYSDASINNMTVEEKKASSSVGLTNSGLYGQSFWLPFKQLVRGTDCAAYGNNVRLNNYVIMRYAEVLLLYAEACLQMGDNAAALTAINQIQTRAGSKTISTTADMDLLKKEKSYELWFEGSRWADLVRWGDVDKVKQAGQNITCLYDKFSREPMPGDENVVWENGTEANSRFYTVSTHGAKDKGEQIGYVDGKHNLFPYPISEFDSNPNLVQNPGW